MPKLSDQALSVLDLALSLTPRKIRRLGELRAGLIGDLFPFGGRRNFEAQMRSLGLLGKWTANAPGEPGKSGLAQELGELLIVMKERQKSVPSEYLPAAGWRSILEEEWAEALTMLSRRDFNAFGGFLGNFFRNGAISGFWGNRGLFTEFARERSWQEVARRMLFYKQLMAWRREVPGAAIEDLDQPRVGNPWGYNLCGRLVIEPAFEYHALSKGICQLLSNRSSPTVLEIGGGFGGLAYQMLRQIPGLRYIGVDLPENTVIQSWFLSHALPTCRVELCRAGSCEMSSAAGAALLPNWELETLRNVEVDVVVNIRSFGEMSRPTLESYFASLVRLQPQWIVHENLCRARGDNLYGISSSEYPPFPGYRLVTSNESRWPRYGHHSGYPCREWYYCRDGAVRAL